MMNGQPQINMLIPLFNEEEVFEELTRRLTAVMDNSYLSISVIMVDDGSRDNTSLLMKRKSMEDPRFVSVILSRNFGHQLALTAGLAHVNATEAVFILDGDLQDPPELLEEFYIYLKQGYDVIYAVRKKRKEIFLKRWAYKGFYMLMKYISYFEIPLDSGDFSLVSRRVIDELNHMKEESRFLRGMRSWIGYKQIGVPYDRQERYSGGSKYTFKRLLSLAYNGIFNFSEFPIKFISNLGVITVLISLIYLATTLVKKFVYGVVPEGFTGLIFAIVLFGGVQLMSIGILGEYIIRIFFQVKNRPLFIVKEIIRKPEQEQEPEPVLNEQDGEAVL
ncbi:MAG TPA: glycosyltransferase family 2 protein [Ohtaekwangia sp.]|uniref:glycosyltransferase family 2 protein n=1 Tax=Ohtaekwangia sp. TaxID=2066019 RepID=UPI002F939A35